MELEEVRLSVNTPASCSTKVLRMQPDTPSMPVADNSFTFGKTDLTSNGDFVCMGPNTELLPKIEGNHILINYLFCHTYT